MSTLNIVAIVVGLLLLVVAIGVLIWWLRTQSGSAVRSFYAAYKQLEQDFAVRDRYEMPWLLMLGNEQQCAQLCTTWNLSPVGKPAWFGRWHADPDGAVLVVPEGLFLSEEGGTAQRAAWWRLLGLLLRLRARRPLDGVIWNVPARSLIDADTALASGLGARRKFIDLLQRLGLSLPVYVVISGMEELPGFQELIAALPEEARSRALGWTSPHAPDVVWQSEWSEIALTQITQALSQAVLELGTLRGEVGAELYCLPQRLAALHGHVQMLLDPVFQGNALGEAPRFRGLYFTATQTSGHADDEWAIAGPISVAQRCMFADQLWSRRIIAEQGLAQAVPRILRLRQRWQQLVGGCAVFFGLCWMAAMIWVWHGAVEDANRLSRILQDAQSRYAAVSNEARRKDVTRQNVQAFWHVLEQAPRWQFVSLAYPTSWFSATDRHLEAVLRGTALTHFFQPLRDLLQADLATLQTIRPSRKGATREHDYPERWPNYVQANSLASGLLNIESKNRWFENALDNPKGPLDDLVLLSNNALDLNLNASTLRREAFYNRVLAERIPLQALDLEENHEQFADQFKRLMQLWLDQYFLGENFVSPAGSLKRYTDKLQLGYGNSLTELEEVDQLIDNLQAMIALTNTAWSRGSGQDLVPGYRNLLESAGKSALLGPSVKTAVDETEASLQRNFRDRWISHEGSRSNLLVMQGSNVLALQEHVIGLDNAIESLLQKDFTVSALANQGSLSSDLLSRALDGKSLDASLNYLRSYERYLADESPQIPQQYRPTLIASAKDAATTAMWYGVLKSASIAQPTAGLSFDVPADKALVLQKAFTELNRPDLAAALQNALNQRALADIDRALGNVDALPLFRTRFDIARWDGSKGMGLALFRSLDSQDLKQSLAQQFATMLSITQAYRPAVEWLKSQQHNVPLADYDKVRRLDALYEEMNKYQAQNPVSSPALFEQLVSRDLNEMDAGSCAEILKSASLAQSLDDVSRQSRSIWESARARCGVLQQQLAAVAWDKLANYFNQYLAGRFPFSYSVQDADADPARVAYMVQLIDAHLEQAEKGLALSQSADVLAAQDFLDRLKRSRTWLAPLFVRDKEGILGLDLEVRWRTDREDERGADQVIAWGLHSGQQAILYPQGEQQRIHWLIGEPMKLMLRWAKNGSQSPANDPLQPSLAVTDLEAGWQYTGPWALLRLIRSHVTVARQPNADYTEFPLTLQLPVYAPYSPDTQAQMFMRLSLMTQGSKLPLSIQPLPVRAPHSPFGHINSTALLSSQEQP
ncbi:type VI secretion system protein [Pseudomonas borbori]